MAFLYMIHMRHTMVSVESNSMDAERCAHGESENEVRISYSFHVNSLVLFFVILYMQSAITL